jgi:hypothetical protein
LFNKRVEQKELGEKGNSVIIDSDRWRSTCNTAVFASTLRIGKDPVDSYSIKPQFPHFKGFVKARILYKLFTKGYSVYK